MKVYLGPFSSRWISRIHDRWLNRRYGEASWTMKEEDYTSFDSFIEKVEGWLQFLYNKTINKILDNRKRKIKIHVDRYDVWNADETIALLVHPLLVKLKETSHGCPCVDDEDVPEELKDTSIDGNMEKRWDYILDEMIWTFNSIAKGDPLFMEFEDDPSEMFGLRIVSQDDEGREKYFERQKNGLRLFAKYFRALWD